MEVGPTGPHPASPLKAKGLELAESRAEYGLLALEGLPKLLCLENVLYT